MKGRFISLLGFTCVSLHLRSPSGRCRQPVVHSPTVAGSAGRPRPPLCHPRGMGVARSAPPALDVVESGRPPRWRPPRALVVACVGLAVVVALVWVGRSSHPRSPAVAPPLTSAAAPVPAFAPSPFRSPYRAQSPGAVEVLLRNENDVRLFIDSVRLVTTDPPHGVVASWAQAAVVWPPTADLGLRRARSRWPGVPRGGLPVASYLGGAVLVVTVQPPCAHPGATGDVAAVIRYHRGGHHYRQTIRTLRAGGRHWFAGLVTKACLA